MTEVAHTLTRLHGRMVVTWAGLSASDTLAPYEPPTGYDLESIQVESDNFDGESVDITGSQDGSSFRSLLAAAVTAPGITAPSQQARSYSGAVSDGGGSPDPVTVTMYFQSH